MLIDITTFFLVQKELSLASYPGLLSQLFLQYTAAKKSCERRPGARLGFPYIAKLKPLSASLWALFWFLFWFTGFLTQMLPVTMALRTK